MSLARSYIQDRPIKNVSHPLMKPFQTYWAPWQVQDAHPAPSALDPGDWMLVLDLRAAYFHILSCNPTEVTCRFRVCHKHFQFSVLPFGLTSIPRVFTKVMVVVTSHLQRWGISVMPYLDNWLLKADSPQTVVNHLQMTVDLLTFLGYSISVLKSHLTRLQRLPFIGAILDMVLF